MGIIAPQDAVYQFLTDPDNSDTPDMNVDGTTPKNYYFTVPPTKRFVLVRFNVVLVDASMQWGLFGAIDLETAGNGCLFQIEDENGGLKLDFTDGLPIKANEDWGALAGTDVPLNAAAGPDALPVRFTVEKSGNRQRLDRNDRIRFSVRDNLTGLVKFRIQVQGYWTP